MRTAIASLGLVIAVALAGCEDETTTAEASPNRAECRKLEDHLMRITPRPGGGGPETDPKRIEALVARVPVEDIEQCAAVKDRKVIACMQAAPDVAALRACIPRKSE
ncbi:MAG TPA: hypothetical protein VK607_02170 [Kofleriaceae bacterium]|nr:hypothetical protein [Kofleriaceae bacterium]